MRLIFTSSLWIVFLSCQEPRIGVGADGYTIYGRQFTDYKELVQTVDSLVCLNENVNLVISNRTYNLNNFCRNLIIDRSSLTLDSQNIKSEELNTQIENYMINPTILPHLSEEPENALFRIVLEDEAKPSDIEEVILKIKQISSKVFQEHGFQYNIRFYLDREIAIITEPPPEVYD